MVEIDDLGASESVSFGESNLVMRRRDENVKRRFDE